jgi:hypothetical protein
LRQQHNVIRPAEELRQVGQVVGEHRLVFPWSEAFAVSYVPLGEGIEHKDIRGAAFGLGIGVQLGDKSRV